MPYRLSALAEQDLEEIWFYVAADASPTAADRLIDAIVDRFELLTEQPRMGRLRPEIGEGLRSFTVENHVIYYRHEGDLLIARVLHGRRDQAAAWSERSGLGGGGSVAIAGVVLGSRHARRPVPVAWGP